MEDLKTASARLVLSSVGLILLLGGWASFANEIPIGNMGLKLTSLYVAPFLLCGFWLYSWQRFFVLARHSNKPDIDKLLLSSINTACNTNQNDLIRSVFRPQNFNLKLPVMVRKWGWSSVYIPADAKADYVVYNRSLGRRDFMFCYLGNDINDNALYVHFGPKASNIQNGTLRPISLGYWKCISFELKHLINHSFKLPLIGAHYFPHIFAWSTLVYLSVWLCRYSFS